MAKFEVSYKITYDNEGGYVNHPDDKGGETIFGISRKFHSSWGGWQLVDQAKWFCTETEGTKEYDTELTGLCKSNGAITRLKLDFFKTLFWNPLQLDLVTSQKIANALFDASVNHDPKDAAKMAQKVLKVKVDGIVGNQTISAINSANESAFLRSFTSDRISYYRSIVEKDKSQIYFLNGWIRRAESFNV